MRQSRLSHALDMAKPYECLIWDRGPERHVGVPVTDPGELVSVLFRRMASGWHKSFGPGRQPAALVVVEPHPWREPGNTRRRRTGIVDEQRVTQVQYRLATAAKRCFKSLLIIDRRSGVPRERNPTPLHRSADIYCDDLDPPRAPARHELQMPKPLALPN